LDTAGDAYLTGYTNYDYPTTPDAYITSEASYYGTYAFVTELNPTGTNLVYSTYLSGKETTGSPDTYGFGIAADAAGNAYVVGTTTSQTYPTTTGAYQTSANCTFLIQGTCTTAFVTKVNVGGSTLSYSTYLGTGSNRANAVAIDSCGGKHRAQHFSGHSRRVYDFQQLVRVLGVCNRTKPHWYCSGLLHFPGRIEFEYNIS
jgi:hypothetical protein